MQKKQRRLNLKLRLLLVLTLLALFSIGIWQSYAWWNLPPYSGLKWQQDQEENTIEAVFRYQIETHRANQQCFLSVQNMAPNPSLMQRFAGLPYVLPLSNRMLSGTRGYIDQNARLPALHFWVNRVDWISDTEVTVMGGGGSANMSGDAGEFTVQWKHRAWHVVKYEPRATF